ncbi:TIGR03087 family PEP-CTERM/XrtA system glycosyltransferase [Novosphingobium lentum]|uniref:TIGR03087 family PEP-CTERM/XrtA system glycosyltransferase n=1 Tax=Novosphingobium lentum TaxID=145287 RepID=UPI00083412B4|nr:TIGR03087 family PEP-CTERM/XrtA system glycosyltransferase [Novosphingobium lentum]
MSEILFIGHRIPFPPDRGDKIRSHHFLKRLAALAPVHVACFADDDADGLQEPELAHTAASHCLVRRSRPVPLAALQALALHRPVSLPAFASSKLARYIDHVLATRPISTIFVFSGQMAQYLPRHFGGRIVMDFVDVDSAKFDAYAARSMQPYKALYAREARLLRRFEERVAGSVDASLFVTPEEVALFESRLEAPLRRDVLAIGNGIDAGYFDPAGIAAAPELLKGGPQIVFTGQMDYPPNIAAVESFATQVMPLVRAAFPQAGFHIVGRSPAASVRALEGVNGTSVAGAVPDVRPWLAAADLVVAPLEIARGVQNKVLEAMAMARPVLVTSAAATGIGAVDGVELAIADGAAPLAERAIDLLGHVERASAMGVAGRRFVIAHRSWASVLEPLSDLVGQDRRARRDAA